MEVKLHSSAERVLKVIKSSMKSERMSETPENIVDAVVTTFLEMSRRNDKFRIPELLQIVLTHKDFLKDDVRTTDFIRRVLLDFKDEGIYNQGFRIIKHFIRNGKFCMSHFRLLLLDCFGSKILKTKSITLIREYLGVEGFRDELVKHILGLTGVDLVRHINCFFDVVGEKVDLKSKLDELSNPDLFKDIDRSGGLYSECCDLIYKYTEMKMSIATPDEGTFEHIIDKLRILFSIPLPRGDKLLKTFSLLSEKDFVVFLKENRHLLRLDTDVKRSVRNEILEAKLNNEQIHGFVKSVRHILIPEFTDLIRYMAEEYMKQESRYHFALGAVVSVIGVEKFFSLVDIGPDIRTWASIMRSSSNTDISFFINLYQRFGEDRDAVGRVILLNCLPAFCNHCSDHSELIETLLMIMKDNMSNTNVFSSICTGLNKLIHSHQNNIKYELVLRNPIPISTSRRIMQAIHSSCIVMDILALAVGRESDESDELLFKLIGMDDLGFTEKIFQCILMYPKMDLLSIGRITLTDILDVMKIAKFFVSRMDPNLDVISKLLELSLSDGGGIQKRAYQLLYYMKLHNKIDICVCDSLFSEEVNEKTRNSSQKWRVSLLYLVYCRGCLCFPDRKTEYFNRMLPVLIMNLKTGNAKTKKMCAESLDELVTGFDETEFEFYCRLMVAGMNSENTTLRCGILEAVTFLVEHHAARLPRDFMLSIFDGCISTSRLGREPVSHVLKFLNALVRTIPVNPEGYTEILELYADSFRNKHMRDIRATLDLLVDKGLEVSKKLRKLLKIRKSRTCLPNLQITKKNDVIITDEKKESGTKFTRHRRALKANKKHKK